MSQSLTILAVLFCVACVSELSAQESAAAGSMLVGREAKMTITLADEILKTTPFHPGDELQVWIASQKKTETGMEYDVHYLPRAPIQADLRDFLIFSESSRASIPPLKVEARNSTEKLDGKLELEAADRWIPNRRYVPIVCTLAVLWIVGLVVLLRKHRSQTNLPVTEAQTVPIPSDSERLESLVALMHKRQLSIDESVEMVRLLREILCANESPTSSGDVQPLLQILEKWFYSPRGVGVEDRDLLLDKCRGAA